MIRKTDIEKIKRFKKGLSTKAEKRYIYSLFTENEHVKEFKQYFSREFDEYLNNADERHNLSYLLDRIHHTIHKNEDKKKRTIVRKVYKWYSLAAAVLLIPLLVATVLAITEQKPGKTITEETPAISTLYAPIGSRIKFSLPDGTKGWLNSGSSLEYNLPFSQNRQIVVLGEAWFDVAHDKSHPFEITAGKTQIKVLGTKFNIDAYPEEKQVEVVLEEGKVEFSTSELSSPIEMKPNERLTFSEGLVNISQTDAAKYSAWIEGKLVFRAEPMAEVARRIERWYNVDVTLMDKDIERDLISGTFQDDSLEDVFQYLSLTSPIYYEIIGQKANADGIIQKTKVLLFRKKIS